ncbi:hypothetical protein GCM10025867_23090 [Frondihabitans sucicola]|uniref:N-acetyltransferase domain-containing protein n=1 Tax=Frondihabitans sucicola TaxID=1268041 RepID=A0ABM8GNP4_9MICO|nr:N-acetyltransferase [Frondihabitans sucicola]BDZ50068.1 hypothetical protein GCM10025867_23090 [Frondihabitans sucicola]
MTAATPAPLPGSSPALMLQRGTDADIDGCVALWLAALTRRDEVAPGEAAADRCRTKFAHARVAFEVLRGPSGAILGFGLVTAPGTGRPDDPADAAYLSLLAVSPELQGSGWGGRLLEALHDAIRRSGLARAVLHVIEDNGAAVRLYERHGWAPIADPFDHPLVGRPTLAMGVEV